MTWASSKGNRNPPGTKVCPSSRRAVSWGACDWDCTPGPSGGNTEEMGEDHGARWGGAPLVHLSFPLRTPQPVSWKCKEAHQDGLGMSVDHRSTQVLQGLLSQVWVSGGWKCVRTSLRFTSFFFLYKSNKCFLWQLENMPQFSEHWFGGKKKKKSKFPAI